MRTFGLTVTIGFLAAAVAGISGQAPARGRGSAAPTPRAGAPPKPDATLAQLMRGVLFPNSNLLFDVQQNDPGAPKQAGSVAGANATATYANVYTGWQVVEGAAAALEESADLMLKPGRVCSNGKPAPTTRADFVKFAGDLREAGRKALAAANARNQQQVSDITNDLADACSSCHEVYRDKGPAGSPERCAP
jgi:hypothetical protein